MIETIHCKCGAIIAAYVYPLCDGDEEWQENKRQYLLKGYSCELLPASEFIMQQCTCSDEEKILTELIPLHTHAEIVFYEDPKQIVYREKDIINLLKNILNERKI